MTADLVLPRTGEAHAAVPAALRERWDPPRAGVLLPSVNTVLERELLAAAGSAVGFHFHSMDLEHGSDAESLGAIAAPASARLLAHVRPRALLFGCISGSMIGGQELDARVRTALEQAVGVPVVLAAAAVADALAFLGVRKVAVGTPYLDWVSASAAGCLRSFGFEITGVASLGLVDGLEMAALLPARILALAAEADSGDAEAVFLSGTDLPTFDVLDEIEAALGKPVVSTNSASWWAVSRALHLDAGPSGPGRLFRVSRDSRGARA